MTRRAWGAETAAERAAFRAEQRPRTYREVAAALDMPECEAKEPGRKAIIKCRRWCQARGLRFDDLLG
jgi:hypothetical protein